MIAAMGVNAFRLTLIFRIHKAGNRNSCHAEHGFSLPFHSGVAGHDPDCWLREAKL